MASSEQALVVRVGAKVSYGSVTARVRVRVRIRVRVTNAHY